MKPEVFWSKVDRRGADECWLWRAAIKSVKTPYGLVIFHGVQTHAHRAAWILTHGPVPTGLHVLHKCDNAQCVRPDHLYLGTHQQNMNDKMERGRHRVLTGDAWRAVHPARRGYKQPLERMARGSRVGSAKLTEMQVLRIKLALKHNRRRYGLHRALAAELGVDRTVIWQIDTGRTWTHVQVMGEEMLCR